MKKMLLLLCLLAGACTSQPRGLQPESLRCQYAADPLGVDDPAPLLGWRIMSPEAGAVQTAYRILVASSPEKLKKEQGDLWDSGRVPSPRSQQIAYAGAPLESGREYFWKVQVWDAQDRPSPWSTPARWTTGLFTPGEWQGEWISSRYSESGNSREMIPHWGDQPDAEYVPADTAALYLRKTVDLQGGIARATAYICGLGYYELYLNGAKVGDAVMDPLFSDYRRSLYYATYDVTGALEKGENCLGILLGNGFFNLPAPDLFQFEKAPWKSSPRVLMNLVVEYRSGARQVIATGPDWKWGLGEISYNCLRGGETIDHTRTQEGWNTVDFDDSAFRETVVVPAPFGKLRSAGMPPMRVCETVAPVAISEVQKGVYLVDFGKNMTGWISLKTSGAHGQEIVCDYNETLLEDGTLDTTHSRTHTRGRFQQERFVLSGEGIETFEPRFTYHGFRYVQLRGLSRAPALEEIVASSVHTALDTTGSFRCSDPAFNNLQRAVVRTLLNSAHGMTAEEATREKMGWTLDAGVAIQSYLYNFAAVAALRKNLQDFIDAQEPSGHIASIVPTNGWAYTAPDGKPLFWDDPWWGGSIFLLVENLFTYTGDTSIIAHAFEPMRRYADFVGTTAVKDLVYWSLGDWLDVNHTGSHTTTTPVVQTSTAGYYWFNERISAYARMLGKEDLAQEYAARAGRIKASFNSAFLDPATGWYRKGSQTAQALPLWLGLVPEEKKALVEARLLDALDEWGNHTTAGFIGSIPLLEYLSESGHIDLAFTVVSQRDSPGWLRMAVDSLSTMGEDLFADRYGSGHHPYGAHIGFWLYKYLGGIRADKARPGFKRFIVAPYFPASMENLEVFTESLYGCIGVSWSRTSEGIDLSVTVPGNTTARLILPAGLKPAGETGQPIELPSGTHRFQLSQ